ncbi:phosphoenolpyruvate synthase [Vibrio sp. 10N.286.49.B3]|uniref:putative PEP-binding protein n=1 Tax=Vibrio sp. 10N.286.49.B3 TaxID=1880855 RepID=UPI000C864F1F|nr:putative PEP-binding protein [Vibrio sp. 10N.286.49.B3]PMH46484.1 phosphoenolpyruvate synthase [Vibrio sp. 10N.286.49.B3]
MIRDNQGSIHPDLILGDVLPSYAEPQNSNHLFVSLSELVMERIFYHPAIEKVIDQLSDIEKSSLEAMLDGQTVAEHFVSTLTAAIMASIEETHKTVRVSLSSADSYAFCSLLGGVIEQEEVNPLLGLRGVSRFASDTYADCFALECSVIKALREQGVDVEIVVPFVRGLSDAAKINDLLAEQGLPRGLGGLKVFFSCDIPSSILLAERLLHYFDGMAVNVDNITQFALGVDKANEALEHQFNPESEAVLTLIDLAVKAASQTKKPVLIVTHALSEYPKLQNQLVDYSNIQTVVVM